MGVNFRLKAAECLGSGQVRLLEEPELECVDRLRQLPALLNDNDAPRRRGLAQMFRLYIRAFDWDSGRAPTEADCARPKDVLAAVHALERELERNPKRYPAVWKLWLRQADGTESLCQHLTGIYRGKRCRLFTDDQGAWAVETESPMRYPVHYPLSELAQVSVSVDPDGSPVTVRIESTSPLAAHQQLLEDLRRVSVLALQKGLLVLPSMA